MENIRKLTINEVLEIVSKTNNKEIENGKKGTGFWLFKKDIDKYPKAYSENSPLKMNYYGLFDNDNANCIALSAVAYDCPFTYNDYPCVIRIESVKNGAGMRMLNWLFYYLQKEGYKGITINIANTDYTEKYKKMGFETYSKNPLYMEKTFQKYISDSVNESESFKKPVERKVIERTKEKIVIEYFFGKNGLGLTDELVEIGKEIDTLSKTHSIVLSDPYFDALDDIYSFKAILYPLSEEERLKRKEMGLFEWENPFRKKTEKDFAEDSFTQMLYMIQDANETKDFDKILDCIYKINELMENPLFINGYVSDLFHKNDNEGIGNFFIKELSKAFKFIETEYIPDNLKHELDMIKWEMNQLIFTGYLGIDPKDLNGSLYLIESYVSGVYGDPTFSTGYPSNRYDAGYKYNIRNLNHDFEGQKQPPTREQILIHVGSYISAKDKNDNWISGRIYRIVKDENGFIKKVWIFDKNGKIINVNIDSITAVPNGRGFISQKIMSYDDINSKYPIVESVKEKGTPVYFGLDGKKYILTLNEGEVIIGEIKNRKVVSLKSVYDIDNKFANKIQKKIFS